jgi:hypothetical protein
MVGMWSLSSLFGSSDFIHMGKGIEARYKRCAAWWRPHLELTKSFVSSAARPGERLAVLGAGRLFDLDLDALLKSSNEVHLFDLDRGCLDAWKPYKRRYGRRIVFRIEDVSASLEEWTARLRSRASSETLDSLLDTLEAREPGWAREGFDGIVSLNILGQIPLYWRDRVLAACPEPDETTSSALDRAMARLQERHLRSICSAARWSAIVSDREYLHYDCSNNVWSVEPALFGSVPALFDLTFHALCPRETWWWHVAPQYVESDECGCVHVVEARARIV